jgi:hypothetical protein
VLGVNSFDFRDKYLPFLGSPSRAVMAFRIRTEWSIEEGADSHFRICMDTGLVESMLGVTTDTVEARVDIDLRDLADFLSQCLLNIMRKHKKSEDVPWSSTRHRPDVHDYSALVLRLREDVLDV